MTNIHGTEHRPRHDPGPVYNRKNPVGSVSIHENKGNMFTLILCLQFKRVSSIHKFTVSIAQLSPETVKVSPEKCQGRRDGVSRQCLSKEVRDM